MHNKTMTKITMPFTWTWKLFPIAFVLILGFFFTKSDIGYIPILVMLLISILIFYRMKSWLNLHNIYINNDAIVIKKSLSFDPKISIPIKNAIKVEYSLEAQQVLGKFWFHDATDGERCFVYFWPTLDEAKSTTSKLYNACVLANELRVKDSV